jgi:hypothetical protein
MAGDADRKAHACHFSFILTFRALKKKRLEQWCDMM